MTTQASTIGTRLPALGVRYEGWVIGQLGLILALVSSALAGPAWSGQLRTAGAAIGIALIAPGVGLTAAGIAWLRRQLTPFPHPVPTAS